jgi:hypothetical protein
MDAREIYELSEIGRELAREGGKSSLLIVINKNLEQYEGKGGKKEPHFHFKGWRGRGII